MTLSICTTCPHGAIKNNRSHCTKEALFSHLTSCIKEKAIKAYLETQAVAQAKT